HKTVAVAGAWRLIGLESVRGILRPRNHCVTSRTSNTSCPEIMRGLGKSECRVRQLLAALSRTPARFATSVRGRWPTSSLTTHLLGGAMRHDQDVVAVPPRPGRTVSAAWPCSAKGSPTGEEWSGGRLPGEGSVRDS